MDHAAYVREVMRSLVPLETGLVAKLPEMPGIRAVVFDIYGTLLISGAGEICPAGTEWAGVVEGSHKDTKPRSEDGEVDAKANFFAREQFGEKGDGFFRVYQETIFRYQEQRRSFGVAFPEVDIREVWVDTLAALGLPPREPAEIEDLSVRFECSVNPVWTMPGAAGVIEQVRLSGLKMGIISNAQFYTLPVMEGLFGTTLDGLGFDPSLQVFSFQVREGKPSRRLFDDLAGKAGECGIEPGQIFYLGNDMSKDVLPARATGFRTGLFAGDATSLRLGEYSAAEAFSLADAVITDLAQIPRILKISS
ncbi:MAG: HAD family hydrolase [Verrucomicrobiales bacterium]